MHNMSTSYSGTAGRTVRSSTMAVGKESNKEKHRQSKSFPPDLMGANIVLHFRAFFNLLKRSASPLLCWLKTGSTHTASFFSPFFQMTSTRLIYATIIRLTLAYYTLSFLLLACGFGTRRLILPKWIKKVLSLVRRWAHAALWMLTTGAKKSTATTDNS